MSLSSSFQPGQRIYAAGLTGESGLLRSELQRWPERSCGIEFTSVQLPGVDQTDFLALHASARTQAFFMTPSVRAGMTEHRCSLHPLDYLGIGRYLQSQPPFDGVVAQFSAPDAKGWCSPGLTADFTPLVWGRARRKIAHINPKLPRLDSPFRVHISEFDDAVEAPCEPLQVAHVSASALSDCIGRSAASLIHDGDTLQFGIGAVIQGVAHALTGHRDLRVFSGMIGPWLKPLWESSAINPDAYITTGAVFGDTHFYDYVGRLKRVSLHDVRHTHSLAVMAQIPRFIAINSAVEVDLLGQVNSERSEGKVQAGAGGLPAFAAGAHMSSHGRLLICLPATARQGQVSRIVPALNHLSACTLPRYLADTVVTEFGIAQLRGLSMEARAQALIAIADPCHHAALAEAWQEMRRSF